VQVLVDISDLISHAFQEFLHELGKICGAREMLPKSCTLSNSLLKIDPPTTSGHVREGTLDGSKVFIKRSRINPKEDLQKVKEVRFDVLVVLPCSCSSVPTNSTDLLSGGRTVETLITSEHRPTSRRYYQHPPARCGMDARRGPDGIYQESPRRRQNWPCKCPSLRRMKCLFPHQLSDTAEGLNYLHSCNVIHGDLKGVRDCSQPYFTSVLTYRQSNILITTIGRARITDFGLVTVTKNPDHRWSALADLERTVRWTAPEILNGQGTYSKEADVFSFAMVTIEARCGPLTWIRYLTDYLSF